VVATVVLEVPVVLVVPPPAPPPTTAARAGNFGSADAGGGIAGNVHIIDAID
jgi:hypothetical protein